MIPRLTGTDYRELELRLDRLVGALAARSGITTAEAWQAIRDVAEKHSESVHREHVRGEFSRSELVWSNEIWNSVPPPQDVPLLISRHSPTSTQVGDFLVTHAPSMQVTAATRDDRGHLLVTLASEPSTALLTVEIGLSGAPQEPPPAEEPPAEPSWRQWPSLL